MININGPFILALTVIIFLVVIKWIEWFLFKNGSFPARQKVGKTDKELKNARLAVFGRKLKGLLFFGKADLKQPWYIGVPFGIYIIGHSLTKDYFDFPVWLDMTVTTVCIAASAWFSVFAMLRSNKEYFAVDDRRKRYIRTQIAQGCLSLIIVAAVVGGWIIYSNHKDPDPPGLRDSVNWVIEPVYDAEWPSFSEGLAAVGYRGKKGFIDREGNKVIPFQYNNADSFHDGVAAVQKDWRWGYVDHTGKVVIPFQYDEAFEFDGGIAPVKMNGKWSVIDKSGNIKFTTEYKTIYPFNEGVAKVEIKDKKYGDRVTENLIDTEGKLILPSGYSITGNFSEGCVFAMDIQTGSGYFIDRNGNKIIRQSYFTASDFSGGIAAVGYGSIAYALIDHNGAVIQSLTEDEYYDYLSCREGLVEVNNGEWDFNLGMSDKVRYGFKDIYGNVLVPVVFSAATASNEGLIGLEVDGCWGFIENPLPAAARGADPELWRADRTQIAAVEGLPVYAGELEGRAYSIKERSPKCSAPQMLDIN